jgi:hypothetical protein
MTGTISLASSSAAGYESSEARMAGVNMDKFRQMADESREYLFEQAGYTLNVLR